MSRKERLKNLTPQQALERKQKIEKESKIIMLILAIIGVIAFAITLKGGI